LTKKNNQRPRPRQYFEKRVSRPSLVSREPLWL